MRDIIFFPCRYHAAVSHSGYLTLTTPYLDMGGAGEVITAARSLYRGESSDNVLGVMGADFPLRGNGGNGGKVEKKVLGI